MIVSATICRNEPDPWLPLMLEQTDKFVDKMLIVVDSLERLSAENLAAISLFGKAQIIQHEYSQTYKGADGAQRNAYLQYLKEQHLGDWAIVIDSDEILDDTGNLYLSSQGMDASNICCAHIKMHHYAWNLGWEDSTYDPHITPTRFFKITPEIHYEEVEHPVLRGVEGVMGFLHSPALHHYGITNGLWMELVKYRRQRVKSNIHSEEQLTQWHSWHLKGELPVKKVPWEQHPLIVRERFKA